LLIADCRLLIADCYGRFFAGAFFFGGGGGGAGRYSTITLLIVAIGRPALVK
jgi:hypothetical protein